MKRSVPVMHSVRTRLILWNVLILALVLFVLGSVLKTIVTRNLQLSLDARLEERANGHVAFWAVTPDDLKPPRDLLPTQGLPPDSVSWRAPVAERVFDLKATQLFPRYQGEGPWALEGFAHAAQGADSYALIREAGLAIRVYSVPLRRKSGRIAGVAQLAGSMEEIERASANLDKALLMLLPLGAAAAWLGGMFLTGRMLQPLRDVTQTAARLGAQDLSQRLAVSGEDEFSELARTFNGMLQRLEGAFEQQRRFTADASHELRTPLTVVKSVASRFLARKDLPDDYRRGIARLDQAAEGMERVVDDMLLLARSDSGQLPLERVPLSLASVLEAAHDLVEHDGGPPVLIWLPEGDLSVLGEASHLTRLFSNLLDNALRHTPPAGEVTVSATLESNTVAITVADTGGGIPVEHLPYLTERFYRLDSARARAQGGTGLGLSICQAIVTAHHGTLQIESTLGKGTSVVVILPTV